MYMPIAIPGTPLDPSDPINKGLVGWWPMWEGAGGKALDISGKNNHVTLFNAPRWVNGVLFDGVDDYGQVSSSGFNGVTAQITMAGWLQTPTPAATRMDIIQRSSSGAGDDWWFNVQNGLVSFYADNITGGVYKQSASAITSKSIFIAVTYDGANIRFYINGALDNTVAATGAFKTATTTVTVGRNWVGSGYFNGCISKLRIFNRGLSALEIQRLYVNPNVGLWTPDYARYYVAAAGGADVRNHIIPAYMRIAA